MTLPQDDRVVGTEQQSLVDLLHGSPGKAVIAFKPEETGRPEMKLCKKLIRWSPGEILLPEPCLDDICSFLQDNGSLHGGERAGHLADVDMGAIEEHAKTQICHLVDEVIASLLHES